MELKYRKAEFYDVLVLTEMFYRMLCERAPTPAIKAEANVKSVYLSLVTRLESPNYQIIVAVDDNKIVALIMSHYYAPEFGGAPVLFVDALYVAESHRQRQIHLELIRQLKEKTDYYGEKQELEFRSCYTPGMIRMYDKLGYKPVYVMYRKKEG